VATSNFLSGKGVVRMRRSAWAAVYGALRRYPSDLGGLPSKGRM
jgi:hypothetical protein